jgi:hypothetical protein
MVHFQFFSGSLEHSIASWSSNPQVMASNLKKSKNFKKTILFFGSHTRQSGIISKFTVEIDIFSWTWNFNSSFNFQVKLEFSSWAWNFNLNMKFTMQYLGNSVTYRECCKFQVFLQPWNQIKHKGPRWLPCSTPDVTKISRDLQLPILTWCNLSDK